MIITVQAISKGLVRIVQGSLMGSIFSNLLLVLGMAIMVGGFVYKEQELNLFSASANSSILLVACIGMTLPVLYSQIDGTTERQLLEISRIVAIIMTIVYIFFIY